VILEDSPQAFPLRFLIVDNQQKRFHEWPYDYREDDRESWLAINEPGF
jgi:hypothetical protein